MKQKFNIAFLAIAIVVMSSIQTYLIAQKLLVLAVCQGVIYSTCVVLVTPKIAFSDKTDKLFYVIGATIGNIIALSFCFYYFK